jgi:hypothetical protein
MKRLIACTLLIAGGTGCQSGPVAPGGEDAAPPDQFMVTTAAGDLSGPPARLDIRHVDPSKPPDVEVALSASGRAGQRWSVLLMAPPDFLQTQRITARVVDGPLHEGEASVQVNGAGADASGAASGLVSLSLYGGRLAGEARRVPDGFAANFEGPFVVSCAIPASSGDGAPAPAAGSPAAALVLDERFESPLCRRFAGLRGSLR